VHAYDILFEIDRIWRLEKRHETSSIKESNIPECESIAAHESHNVNRHADPHQKCQSGQCQDIM